MLSTDANVVVLVLYYVEKFVREAYKNFRYGTDDHTRYLPIHFMDEQLGVNFYSSLLNTNILTGYGMKIKIVPKSATKVKLR